MDQRKSEKLDSWHARHQDRDHLALQDRDACQDHVVTKRDSRCWNDDGSTLMHATGRAVTVASTNRRNECANKHVVPRQGHCSANANDIATSRWAPRASRYWCDLRRGFLSLTELWDSWPSSTRVSRARKKRVCRASTQTRSTRRMVGAGHRPRSRSAPGLSCSVLPYRYKI